MLLYVLTRLFFFCSRFYFYTLKCLFAALFLVIFVFFILLSNLNFFAQSHTEHTVQHRAQLSIHTQLLLCSFCRHWQWPVLRFKEILFANKHLFAIVFIVIVLYCSKFTALFFSLTASFSSLSSTEFVAAFMSFFFLSCSFVI